QITQAQEQAVIASVQKTVSDAIAKYLVKRVDQYGNVVDWVVRGSDTSASFTTKGEAVNLIVRAMRSEIVQNVMAAAGLDDDDRDTLNSVVPGLSTPMALDGPTDHVGNLRKPSL